ncbi:HD domain-containing protein [Salipiger abyssi]|uniref:Putative hydrolases of HD superfamily n=1 Tax=Salipiger abyssi TaxID=1250539 RepID=A0A1P8UPM3_9RHOB|nr:HD domain-containing protein [Salipiger abyssi]APZ51346.1 putative hydrolases of HD superfamily [Salipiger abyssi]
MSARLDAQMAFLMEADRLKAITRATRNHDGRRENSAEHSWHLALFALVLEEHAPEPVDIHRVIRMLLIHDLVEIDAGDAPIYGKTDAAAQAADERAAAERLFGLLPQAQGAELLKLWEEFEANETPDARFAKSLDRFQPPNLNLLNGGGSWTEYNVTQDLFEKRVGTKVARGAPALWAWLQPRVAAFFGKA